MTDYSLVPVDHQPEFDHSLMAVDHDPFAAGPFLLAAGATDARTGAVLQGAEAAASGSRRSDGDPP